MHAKICMLLNVKLTLSHMMPLGNRRRDNLRRQSIALPPAPPVCAAISVSQNSQTFCFRLIVGIHPAQIGVA